MDITQVVALVKERLGIRSTVRDAYLNAIADGVIKELEDEKGLALEADNSYHLLFVVDYVTWRYQSVNSADTPAARTPLSMPRHLQFRLHNLMVHLGVKHE